LDNTRGTAAFARAIAVKTARTPVQVSIGHWAGDTDCPLGERREAESSRINRGIRCLERAMRFGGRTYGQAGAAAQRS